MRSAFLLLVACSQTANAPRPSRVEPCWFDRSASSLFATTRDGDLVVVRGTTVSRVRRDGSVAWNAAIEVPGHVEAIALDGEEFVLVGEVLRSEDAAPQQRLPGCFVTRYAGRDGRVRWSTTLAGTGQQFCRDLAIDQNGDVLVAGYFEHTLEAEGRTLASAGSHDVVVLRVAGKSGRLQWTRQLGGRHTDMARGIAIDRHGDVIVGGNFSGAGTPADGAIDFGAGPVRSAGDFDAFVVKLRADGRTLWARTFGDVGFDLVKSIAADRDGNLYVVGAWMRPQDFRGEIPFHEGVMDGFVARYTRDGALVWRHVFRGGDGSHAHDVAIDGLQRPWIVGHVKGAVAITNRTVGTSQRTSFAAYVARLDPKGSVRWTELVGPPGGQFAYRLAVASDESIVVGGRAEGDGAFCGASRAGPPDGDDYIEWFKRGYL